MLRELFIKNVAVIEDVHIEFDNGLNVLTGETGAGKSIIIDSINMILGERTSREFVRHNSNRARVQAVFDANDEAASLCTELGAEIEDNCVILSRDITFDGKSTARINGVVVPLTSMREVASVLVNIHGQHDNQALLSPARHIEFLDEYAKNSAIVNEYSAAYNDLKDVKFRICELMTGEKQKQERADLLRYQVEEIEAAQLCEGEEEELVELRDQILNAENISQSCHGAYHDLYSSDTMGCAYDAISAAISKIESVSEYSKTLSDAYTTLLDAKYIVEDAAHNIKSYAETVEFDKSVLDDTEQRLDLINKLKRKYGGEIPDILKYLDNAQKELDMIDDIDGSISKLTEQEQVLSGRLQELADKLSDSRKKAAEEINKKITDALHELNMEQARFEVEITSCEPMSNGCDNVQFMISANAGEPLKPLTKIASGGELSRTMLALKSILTDGVDTLIFDEIDTGVSGMAAKKIAVKLFEISLSKQVLCITHLPQLASMSDHHFLISKNITDSSVKTSVSRLDDNGKVIEIARLSGGSDTDVSKAHAKELLDNCDLYKRRIRA